MKVYKGTTPVKIYNGNHKMPKIYKGSTLLCSDTNNYHWRVPNMVSNGNFVDATGWNANEGSLSVANNTAIHTSNGAQTYARITRTDSASTVGHTYALTLRVRVTNEVCTGLRARIYDGTTIMMQENPVENHWYPITVFRTIVSPQAYIWIMHDYPTAAIASGKKMEVQYVSCVDLTALEADLGITITQENYEDWISKLQDQYIDQFAMW